MRLTVNDEEREFGEAPTVGGLLESMRLAGRRGLAVAVNESVVPSSDWGRRRLAEGDKVLLIQATQGG